MKINFEYIITKAYEILILQPKLEFPLNILNLKTNLNIKILTFSELARLNNCTFEEIASISDGAEAFKYEAKGLILIVYNEKITNTNRIRWSIAHEFGHIVLNHKGQQSDQFEIEANFFAANLLLPRCLLKELVNKRDFIDLNYLQKKFSISKEASEKFFSNINSRGFNYFQNEYDDIILAKCEKFINSEIKDSKKMQLLDEESMQAERDNWLYE